MSQRRIYQGFVVACALMMAWLAWRDAQSNWVHSREMVNIELGLWSTRLLIATLAVTPVSVWLREPQIKRFRRPLGVATFVFTVAHAVHYLIYADIWPSHLNILVERPYLTVGVVALVLLSPLVASSTNAAVRWLSPQRWRRVHRLIYPAAALVAAHEVLAGVYLLGEEGLHVLAIAGLLGWRAVKAARGWLVRGRTAPRRGPPAMARRAVPLS